MRREETNIERKSRGQTVGPARSDSPLREESQGRMPDHGPLTAGEPEADEPGGLLRRVLVEARDRAAEPLMARLSEDRKKAPPTLEAVLGYLEEHLFDADLSVQAVLDATGVTHNVTTLASKHLKKPLSLYFRGAQIQIIQRLPAVLLRDYGLEAPTGQIAAVAGLPTVSSFRQWHRAVTGEVPEIFAWPKLLKPGSDYFTYSRFSRGALPVDAALSVRNHLALIARFGKPPGQIPSLRDHDPITRAKAATVARIEQDKDLLPEDLLPLLDCIAEKLFDGLNAAQAIHQAAMSARTASDQVRFYLGHTVKSYLTTRWVETAAHGFGESDLSVEEVGARLGQPAKRTIYRLFLDHTGENPGDLRRGDPAAEDVVGYDSWWQAWLGVRSAIREVTAALEAMIAAAEATGRATAGKPPRPEGLLSPVEAEARKRPAVAAYVGLDVLWRDPQKIEECLRAALDASCRSRLFEDYPSLEVGGSDLAQIACLAARERLWKTREADVELVVAAELAAGVELLRDPPGEETVRDALAFIRTGLDRLARNGGGEISRLMAELKVGRSLVRECLVRSVDMEFSERQQAVKMAGEVFAKGLLSAETNPDEHRWAVAAEAELARIAAHYTEAKALLTRVDLNQPFADIVIYGTVRWIAGVIQGQTGEWNAALHSLDQALLLMETGGDRLTAAKVRDSRATILVYRGDKTAYEQFQICLKKAGDDSALRFSAMCNLIITKVYLSLPVELPFRFEEFVAVAETSPLRRAWIPYCKALLEKRPRIARSLFLRARREFAETMQILPRTFATLFAAMEAAKDSQIPDAFQLGMEAAMSLTANQAFGGRLALAAEAFLANLRVEIDLGERIHTFLRQVQMPYRNCDVE